MTIILQSYMQTLINFKSYEVFKFKSHTMFRPIWTSSGVNIYVTRKPLLFVVPAITCVGPSDVHTCCAASCCVLRCVSCSFSQVVGMIEKRVVVYRLGHSSGGARHWLLTTEARVISCEVCGVRSCMEQVSASNFFGFLLKIIILPLLHSQHSLLRYEI
jgi:hypothetical protein